MSTPAKQEHKVKKNESLEEIAKKYGHKDWKVIWSAPENKKLVQKRKKPEAIDPGDVLFIPLNDKQKKEQEKSDKAAADKKAAELKAAQTLLKTCEEDVKASKAKLKALVGMIKSHVTAANKAYQELLALQAKTRKWALGADVTAAIATAAATMASAFQNIEKATASQIAEIEKHSEKLVKAGKECIKLIGTNFPGVANAARNYSDKVALLDGNRNKLAATVGSVGKWINKGLSPSFWANTISQKMDGKTWSEAAKSEVGDDLEEQIQAFNKQENAILQELKARATEERDRIAALEKDLKSLRDDVKKLESGAKS